MRASFKAGQVDAGALHLAFGKTPQSYFKPADAGTANYRELWWRFRLKYQAGWTGASGWKVSRMFSFASATTWAQSITRPEGSSRQSSSAIVGLGPPL